MYIVVKKPTEYQLVEKRNDDTPPVVLDTSVDDQKILSELEGQEIHEDSFEVIEEPIYGYADMFNTIAKLK